MPWFDRVTHSAPGGACVYTVRMTLTDHENCESKLAWLEKRLHRTERSLQFHKIGWILLAVVVVLLLGSKRFGIVQAQSPQPHKLRLRELDIVDEKGRERIVIAAPIPEPLVNGRAEHRVREVSAAVQFKAPDGTEQGGIAMSDDGSMIVGIDDERDRRERTCTISRSEAPVFTFRVTRARERFHCCSRMVAAMPAWR